jgi:hypothetical protein
VAAHNVVRGGRYFLVVPRAADAPSGSLAGMPLSDGATGSARWRYFWQLHNTAGSLHYEGICSFRLGRTPIPTAQEPVASGPSEHGGSIPLSASPPKAGLLDHDICLRARNRQHFDIERFRGFHIKGKYEPG